MSLPVKRSDTYSDTFSVKCESCRFSRGFGAAKLNAGLAASRHSRKNLDHVVIVLEHRVLDVITRKGQPTLAEDPPF